MIANLELTGAQPDWMKALSVALTLPPGQPERRAGQDHWHPEPTVSRPQRISDDLAWLREAMDEPALHGLEMIGDGTRAVAWKPETELFPRLTRLRDRGVLAAAGLVLHEADIVAS